MRTIYEPDFVKSLFNHMSGSYERMNFVTSFGFSILWRKQFLRKISASDSEIKVIDLLSGLGENWKLLTRKFPEAEFYALDFSEAMLAKSKNKNHYKLGDRFKIFDENILV